MKDWIIISWYEGGYCGSISIDGEIKYGDEIERIEDKTNPYKHIWDAYLGDFYGYAHRRLLEELKEKYHKNILICEDGCIEIVELD